MIRVESETRAYLRWLAALERRRRVENAAARRVARKVVADVRRRGDGAVSELLAEFDGVTLAPDAIAVAPADAKIES
ncbi:MAG: hypothetical protein WBX15_02980, partial [Thermoanaerobaculia bacterium]